MSKLIKVLEKGFNIRVEWNGKIRTRVVEDKELALAIKKMLQELFIPCPTKECQLIGTWKRRMAPVDNDYHKQTTTILGFIKKYPNEFKLLSDNVGYSINSPLDVIKHHYHHATNCDSGLFSELDCIDVYYIPYTSMVETIS